MGRDLLESVLATPECQGPRQALRPSLWVVTKPWPQLSHLYNGNSQSSQTEGSGQGRMASAGLQLKVCEESWGVSCAGGRQAVAGDPSTGGGRLLLPRRRCTPQQPSSLLQPPHPSSVHWAQLVHLFTSPVCSLFVPPNITLQVRINFRREIVLMCPW